MRPAGHLHLPYVVAFSSANIIIVNLYATIFDEITIYNFLFERPHNLRKYLNLTFSSTIYQILMLGYFLHTVNAGLIVSVPIFFIFVGISIGVVV